MPDASQTAAQEPRFGPEVDKAEPTVGEASLAPHFKAELKRRNVGYRELAEKLETLGIHETERNIANKISRGGFTAVFFVQCLTAIGATEIRLN